MAAIAATPAFLAAVIRAGVLGAVGADFRGRLVTDAAQKSGRFRHNPYLADAGFGAAGRAGAWRTSVPRQRCAS